MQHTTKTSTISIRVDHATKERLERAAKAQNRSKSFVAVEAIEQLLAIYEQQDEMVRAAIVSADRGELISHEDMMAWVNSLDTDSPLPSPKVTK